MSPGVLQAGRCADAVSDLTYIACLWSHLEPPRRRRHNRYLASKVCRLLSLEERSYARTSKWIFSSCRVGETFEQSDQVRSRKDLMRTRVRFAFLSLSLMLLALIPASAGSSNKQQTVYVCACLKTKSCACMTEAKMQGPCACGTEGGPPMKAVPADSDWAKQNRNELAK